MPKVRAHNISMSVDGYMAGPEQSLDNPLGVDGERLHDWVVATRSFRQQHGWAGNPNDGATGIDDDFARQHDIGFGATIMGRNMYGPIRGEWGDEEWKGWWGDEPPFHHPVFVLTHHPHASIPMEGGTTFHFVDGGIETALDRALEAAGGADVRIGGGASTIRQFLRAGALDELHVAIVPILLGAGERLFDHLDGLPAGYECVEFVASPAALHVRIARMTT